MAIPQLHDDVNLLPKYERPNRRGIYLFLLLLLLLILAFGSVGFLYNSYNKEIERLTSIESDLNLEVTQLTTNVTALKEGQLSGREEAFAFIEGHYFPTSYLIEQLYDFLPSHSYLHEYRYSNQTVDILTQFQSMNQTAHYLTKLENSQYVNEAKIDEIEAYDFLEEEERKEFSDKYHYEAKYNFFVNVEALKEAKKADE